jgi:GcrA cell cycle regulator
MIAPVKAKAGAKPAQSPFVQLAELTATTCRWPLGSPTDNDFSYCGAPCDPPYCNAHRRLAYHATRAPIIPPANLNASNDE